jgi:predicted peroxiredoxin
MTNRFCVTATHAGDDPDRATVAWVVANAALAGGKDTMIFLSIDAVRVAAVGGADGIHQAGFAPLAELIATFGANGGKILVCTPCAKARGIDTQPLVSGAVLGGGAGLVEFMTAEGTAASVSY